MSKYMFIIYSYGGKYWKNQVYTWRGRKGENWAQGQGHLDHEHV